MVVISMMLGIVLNMIIIIVMCIMIVSLSDIIMFHAFSASNLNSALIVQMC